MWFQNSHVSLIWVFSFSFSSVDKLFANDNWWTIDWSSFWRLDISSVRCRFAFLGATSAFDVSANTISLWCCDIYLLLTTQFKKQLCINIIHHIYTFIYLIPFLVSIFNQLSTKAICALSTLIYSQNQIQIDRIQLIAIYLFADDSFDEFSPHSYIHFTHYWQSKCITATDDGRLDHPESACEAKNLRLVRVEMCHATISLVCINMCCCYFWNVFITKQWLFVFGAVWQMVMWFLEPVRSKLVCVVNLLLRSNGVKTNRRLWLWTHICKFDDGFACGFEYERFMELVNTCQSFDAKMHHLMSASTSVT